MNDITLIQNKIYEIRGQRVMLDFDLAPLYQVQTKVLNQAIAAMSVKTPQARKQPRLIGYKTPEK